MKLKYMILTAIALVCLALFAACSKDDKSSSEGSDNSEVSQVTTSVVTVTDMQGNAVTDADGNAVTSVVTNDRFFDSTTTAPSITSLSETVISYTVAVTDSNGSTVTDSRGEVQTSIVTSVSQVAVTVKSTTTGKSVTAAANKTASATTAAKTSAASVSSAANTTTAVTTTTTSKSTSSAADITLKFSEIDYPSTGDCFGTVSIPVVGIEMDLYMGDTDKILRKGIGLFYGSYLPGYEGKSILCGHNSAGYLADLVTYYKSNSLIGETINISTTYGDYIYEIYETKVLTDDDTSYFTKSYDTSTLILYSCMETTYTNERVYFVAKKLSGPVLVR